MKFATTAGTLVVVDEVVDVLVLVDVLVVVVVLGGVVVVVVVVVLPPGTVVVVVVLPGTVVVVVVLPGTLVVVVLAGTVVVVVVPPGTVVVVVLDVVVVVVTGVGIVTGCLRIGMSPVSPHWKLADVVKPVFDSRRSQTPVDGRKTAKSVLPSPSKSPGTGTSLAAPHWNVAKLW